MRAVVGIDPGGRNTGLVVMVDGRLAGGTVIVRKGKDPLPDAAYLLEVLEMASGYVDAGDNASRGLGAIVAVEGLTKPTGFRASGGKGLLNPLDLAGPAMVIGAVLAHWPGAIIVPPGGNGSKPLYSYPPEIQPRAGGKGSDRNAHARSAWDIALAGLSLSVLRTAQVRR